MSATTNTKPSVYGVGHKIVASDLRDVLADLGFQLHKPEHEDYAQRMLSINHPQDERCQLVVVINVNNVWEKDGAYEGVNIFTLYGSNPLNLPGHPLNVIVGLPQLHDLTMFRNVVEGIAIRFRGIDVDDAVRNWYSF